MKIIAKPVEMIAHTNEKGEVRPTGSECSWMKILSR
jgi:hypothetical protein